MKVALLHEAGPEGRLSGSARYVARLARRLDARGTPTVRFPHAAPAGRWARYRAIHLADPAFASALGGWLRVERPNVIHSHLAFDETLALLRDLPDDAPPTAISFHTYEPVCPIKTHVTRSGRACDSLPGVVCLRERCRSLAKWTLHDVMGRRLRQSVAARAAVWIAHNRELADRVRDLGLAPVRYIPLGVDPPPSAPDPAPRRAVLLYAGRVRPEKGIATLARALPDILKRAPDATIRIAGEGPSLPELRAAVAPQHVGRVHFLGTLGDVELQREYASARALIVPSVWKENFAQVGAEAMAHGTPVIGSDLGGIREWLRPGVNGIAIAPGDAQALADAALSLLLDATLAARLGAAAAETARELSLDRHVEALREVYRAIG